MKEKMGRRLASADMMAALGGAVLLGCRVTGDTEPTDSPRAAVVGLIRMERHLPPPGDPGRSVANSESTQFMDTHSVILNFRDAINCSYAKWRFAADAALERDRGFLDEAFGDWAQAHWELLVERVLCNTKQFLDIYGSGSDYEMAMHSRVFFHDSAPTHEVVCQGPEASFDLLGEARIDLQEWTFDKFVSFTDNWYDECPPFDHVMLTQAQSDRSAIIALSNITFIVREIQHRNRTKR